MDQAPEFIANPCGRLCGVGKFVEGLQDGPWKIKLSSLDALHPFNNMGREAPKHGLLDTTLGLLFNGLTSRVLGDEKGKKESMEIDAHLRQLFLGGKGKAECGGSCILVHLAHDIVDGQGLFLIVTANIGQ